MAPDCLPRVRRLRQLLVVGRPRLPLLIELCVRLVLAAVFAAAQHVPPRVREIHQEEWWLYRNRPAAPYIPSWWIVVMVTAAVPALIAFLTRRWPYPQSEELTQQSADSAESGGAGTAAASSGRLCRLLLGYSLALLLTGVITDAVKLTVGPPRPDFFYRCFPEGAVVGVGSEVGDSQSQFVNGGVVECVGEPDAVSEGRKSFPSGHASMSFASLAYLSLFLACRLRPFVSGGGGGGGGDSWRLLTCLSPCLLAVMVGLSRLADWHHHAEDVAVGSLLGASVAYASYRAYFPPPPAGCPDLPASFPAARRIDV